MSPWLWCYLTPQHWLGPFILELNRSNGWNREKIHYQRILPTSGSPPDSLIRILSVNSHLQLVSVLGGPIGVACDRSTRAASVLEELSCQWWKALGREYLLTKKQKLFKPSYAKAFFVLRDQQSVKNLSIIMQNKLQFNKENRGSVWFRKWSPNFGLARYAILLSE